MKKHIGVAMGGYTSEHDISIKSGENVIKLLSKASFEISKIIVTKENWIVEYKDEKIKLDLDSFTFLYKKKRIEFDVIFNSIHGSPGENGELQLKLKKLNIPFTGVNQEVAKMTYDKFKTLNYLKKFGITVSKNILIKRNQSYDLKKIIKFVGLPCFVKANKSGSSYGIEKINFFSEMKKSVENCFKYDDELIIEEYIDGREISVGMIDYKNETLVLPPTEIVTKKEFFDYDAKYNGLSEEITPARINDFKKKQLDKICLKIHQLLRMKGLCRADFIYKNEKAYFLEINSIPGLTEESILPKQIMTAGIKIEDIIHDMVISL